MDKHMRRPGLSLILALSGLFIFFTGLNVALGGIKTMGWQGPTNFVQVVHEQAYLVHDSHTRFLGMVWAGMGAVFLLAVGNVRQYYPALQIFCVLIFCGGLARLGQMRTDIIFGPAILGSLLAELIGVPILLFWLNRVVRHDRAS